MVRIIATIIGAIALAALAIGCGSGGSAPEAGLADFAPPGSLVFAALQLQPKGELKSNAEATLKRLTGSSSLASLVESQLEGSLAKPGTPLDFAAEVEPWLGDRAGLAFARLVDGELSKPVAAIEVSDPEAAEAFVEKRIHGGRAAAGVDGETLLVAPSEKEYEAAVEASEGESLADEDGFQQTMSGAAAGSLADVYLDFGGILEGAGGRVDPRLEAALQAAGIEAGEATAVASVIPRSEQLEIALSSEVPGGKTGDGVDVSGLLGSAPADSVAAFAFSDFGEQLEEAFDSLDESGAPPDLEPGELKSTFARAGIDLDQIAGSLEDGVVFVQGRDRSSLGGALVLTGKSSEAADAIASMGGLLRSAHVPGITAVTGGASGFSIHTGILGDKPIVVVGRGNRVSIGYGPAPALLGSAESGAKLAATPAFEAAEAALGKTPISGFLDGPAALGLLEALVPRSNDQFWSAVPYLRKVSYVGIGGGGGGEPTRTEVIVGLGK